MPIAPLKPCTFAGCSALTKGGRCPAHAKAREQYRGSSTERGYGSDWQRLRRWFLSRNPLCVKCKAAGMVTPAEEVDHITPHKGDERLRMDVANLQALCKPCHSAKTATEDGGFGR